MSGQEKAPNRPDATSSHSTSSVRKRRISTNTAHLPRSRPNSFLVPSRPQTPRRTSGPEGTSGSENNPIDITGSPSPPLLRRPPPTTTNQNHTIPRSRPPLTNTPRPSHTIPGSRPPTITTSLSPTIPRWQDDSETNACPVCHNAFGLLFRRHHCRRCGRVVCNNCSQHRITIPSQHVVRSPPPTRDSLPGLVTRVSASGNPPLSPSALMHERLALDARYRTNTNTTVGERVRVCDPCVPDPNPNPLPSNSASASNPGVNIHRPNRTLALSGSASRTPQRSAQSPHTPSTLTSTSRSGSTSTSTSTSSFPPTFRNPFTAIRPPLAPPSYPHPQASSYTHPYLPSPTHAPLPTSTTPDPRRHPELSRAALLQNAYLFRASEKDCTKPDGDGAAECQICLEELEPGVKLARLQCWCKVHEDCIVMWWGRCAEHLRGRCPEHIGF